MEVQRSERTPDGSLRHNGHNGRHLTPQEKHACIAKGLLQGEIAGAHRLYHTKCSRHCQRKHLAGDSKDEKVVQSPSYKIPAPGRAPPMAL